MSKHCFGVDIGGTTIKMGLFTEGCELVEKWEIPTDKTDSGKNILIDVAKAIGMSHEEFVKLPQCVQINWAKLVYQYGYCKPTR